MQSNSKKFIVHEANHQCYYCGCSIDDEKDFQPNSAVINLYIPRGLGGSKIRANLVASCYVCAIWIKKGMDTRTLSVDQVRKIINLERKRMGFAYNEVYANSDCDVVIQLSPSDYPGPSSSLVKDEPVAHSQVLDPTSPSGFSPKELLDQQNYQRRVERGRAANAFLDAKFGKAKPLDPSVLSIEELEEQQELARNDAARRKVEEENGPILNE